MPRCYSRPHCSSGLNPTHYVEMVPYLLSHFVATWVPSTFGMYESCWDGALVEITFSPSWVYTAGHHRLPQATTGHPAPAAAQAVILSHPPWWPRLAFSTSYSSLFLIFKQLFQPAYFIVLLIRATLISTDVECLFMDVSVICISTNIFGILCLFLIGLYSFFSTNCKTSVLKCWILQPYQKCNL